MMILRGRRSAAPPTIRRGDKRTKILLIALLAVILLSGLFIVTHMQHDHTGPGCHTCTEISICRLIIDGIALAALLIFITGRAGGRLGAPRAGLIALIGLMSKTSFLSYRVRLNC
jgi:hypothetical protein